MTKFKNRRGFSLVELMVVVAIMGTLAAIAIPAYNEYRKAAKKTAYKTDGLSFHKGVLAFGVELDSFCERDTEPDDFSINNVGMSSLGSSKLYGSTSAYCTGTNTGGTVCTTQAACTAARDATNCGATWVPAGNGPGKTNLIGFSDAHTNCSNISATNNAHVLRDAGATTDTDCALDVNSYKLGVFGQIAGKDYYRVQINEDGVIEEGEGERSTPANKLEDGDFGETCA